jgi:hypothetical protein
VNAVSARRAPEAAWPWRATSAPAPGPWHRASGQDDLTLMLLELAGSFGDTFRQDGRCVYADDRVSISLIHETGTAPGGDQFDNLAVYIGRLRPDGGRPNGSGPSTSTPSTAKPSGRKLRHTLEGLFFAAPVRCSGRSTDGTDTITNALRRRP